VRVVDVLHQAVWLDIYAAGIARIIGVLVTSSPTEIVANSRVSLGR
jgi:hypothetical protein